MTGEPLTGRDLLAWLQAHPDDLDRPVHVLVFVDAEEDQFVTAVELDQFDETEGLVISLLAGDP